MIRAVLLTLLLSGCSSWSGGWWGGRDEVIVRPPDLYTRPEVDAINAETQCRQLARKMLEAQRCGVRRY